MNPSLLVTFLAIPFAFPAVVRSFPHLMSNDVINNITFPNAALTSLTITFSYIVSLIMSPTDPGKLERGRPQSTIPRCLLVLILASHLVACVTAGAPQAIPEPVGSVLANISKVSLGSVLTALPACVCVLSRLAAVGETSRVLLTSACFGSSAFLISLLLPGDDLPSIVAALAPLLTASCLALWSEVREPEVQPPIPSIARESPADQLETAARRVILTTHRNKLSTPLRRLAGVLLEQHDTEGALRVASEALSLDNAYSRTIGLNVSESLITLGRVHKAKADKGEASMCFRAAADVLSALAQEMEEKHAAEQKLAEEAAAACSENDDEAIATEEEEVGTPNDGVPVESQHGLQLDKMSSTLKQSTFQTEKKASL